MGRMIKNSRGNIGKGGREIGKLMKASI